MESAPECNYHGEREAIYICLDPVCKKEPKCCLICVKNDHHKCNDNLVIKQSKVPSYVQIMNTGSSAMDAFKKKMEVIFEDVKEQMVENYNQYVNGSLGILGSDTIKVENLNNSESIKNIKENFNIEVTDDDTIQIAPRFNPGRKDIDEDLEVFKKNLENKLTKFSEMLRKVRFYNSDSISPQNFNIHAQIGKTRRIYSNYQMLFPMVH